MSYTKIKFSQKFIEVITKWHEKVTRVPNSYYLTKSKSTLECKKSYIQAYIKKNLTYWDVSGFNEVQIVPRNFMY